MFLFLQLFYSIETFKVKSRHEKKQKNEEASYALMREKLPETLARFFFF